MACLHKPFNNQCTTLCVNKIPDVYEIIHTFKKCNSIFYHKTVFIQNVLYTLKKLHFCANNISLHNSMYVYDNECTLFYIGILFSYTVIYTQITPYICTVLYSLTVFYVYIIFYIHILLYVHAEIHKVCVFKFR